MSNTIFSQGSYRGRLLTQKISTAGTGTTQLELAFQILDEASEGVRRIVYLYLTPKALKFNLAALKAIGFTAKNIILLDPSTPGFSDLTGRVCELVCEHDEYLGQPREKWSIYVPRAARPVSPAAMQQIAETYNPRLEELANQAAIQRATQTVLQPTPQPAMPPAGPQSLWAGPDWRPTPPNSLPMPAMPQPTTQAAPPPPVPPPTMPSGPGQSPSPPTAKSQVPHKRASRPLWMPPPSYDGEVDY